MNNKKSFFQLVQTKIAFIVFCISSILMVSCQSKIEVDTILTGGKIYTVDLNFTIVQAVAIKDGKFFDTGSTAKIQAKYTSKNSINLDGKYVYPGLIDPHCHFYGYANTLSNVNVAGTKSIEEIIEKCKNHAKKHKNEWITGRGWDQNDWEIKEFPDKTAFDSVFADIPILLRRIDGHAAWANSKALEIAGITSETSIEGGKILLRNNKPTGILIDQAISLVERYIPEINEKQIEKNLIKAQKNCFTVGLTSISDAGLHYKQIQLIDTLQKQHKLLIKVYAMLEPTLENIKHYVTNGFYTSERLNIRSVKLYADGALGSRGACLLEPYSDDTLNFGLIIVSKDSLEQICQLAYDNNFQVNTHCIGDSANRLMLNIYGKCLKERNNKRWRIEHAQVINPNDFDLYGKYSIIPSIQTTHCTSDMYWATDRLGDDRIKGAYAWQKLLKQNNWLANGSDFPVEDINPLYGFYAAITRQDQNGFPKKGFFPKQRLSRMQALKAMTIWAACAQFEENEKGSIESGKSADFIITSKDLISCDVNETFKIKIEQTYSNGKIVYQRSSNSTLN